MIRYDSTFNPSTKAEKILRDGKMIGEDESPADMISRVTTTIGEQELDFTRDEEAAQRFAEQLGAILDAGDVVMSTPVMTNAGRHTEKPLTACTVPTISLGPESRTRLRTEIIHLHEEGMGTGFNLDETADPVETLQFLNGVAIESANSGREERPVGNMAVLSVYHPKIMEFINAKTDTSEVWKFNISVNLDKAFMDALEAGDYITLGDGASHRAQDIFDEICNAATVCADPGILFLDRMNARNPVPGLGEYKTTAPCAEVGLIEGETCQFGYINVGNFVNVNGEIDFAKISEVATVITRALDDSLQVSQQNMGDPDAAIRNISTQKRKIGIGLCGVADALSIMGIPYDSAEGRAAMQDVLSLINFVSKKTSVQLASERGSFGAMNLLHLDGDNRHTEEPSHIENLYGNKTTNTVTASQWQELSEEIRRTRNLRNVSTVALPPTGRSALVIDASTGIEPHFDPLQANERVVAALAKHAQARYGIDIFDQNARTPEVTRLLSSAHSIKPLGHVAMAAALQEFNDEAVAKTINLPHGSTPQDVAETYLAGYQSGMSGVTVYVDGSYNQQPVHVK
jgi:ribonucleoside-diphosphate reductase alpha chain